MAAPIVDEHWHWHSLVAWRSFQTVISRPARSSTDLLWRTANPAALRKTGESSDVEVLRFSQGRPRVVPVYLICVRQMRCNDCRASVCFSPTHPRRNEMNLVRRRACVHHKMYGGWAVARDGPMGSFTPSESFTRFQHPLEGGAWHKADIPMSSPNVRFWGKRTSRFQGVMPAFDPKRTSSAAIRQRREVSKNKAWLG
jgi:hypothetical protein